MVDLARIGTYVGVVAMLVTIFWITTGSSGFRLQEAAKDRLAITPATTVSKFPRHFVAGLLHENVVHIGFNLLVFTLGFWLASHRLDPFATVGTSYAIGILTVFLTHILVVLPLARLGLPYATRALDVPLVGFSVIAYATLGAGLRVLPKVWQLAAFGGVFAFEIGAAFLVTLPFISVYHLGGLLMGYYVRSLVSGFAATS